MMSSLNLHEAASRDVNAKDDIEKTPLHLAVKFENYDVITVLLQAGVIGFGKP